MADNPENFRLSLLKKREMKMEVEVQRSVKAGVREFLNSPEPLTRNLILSCCLWFITVMNYQINAYYANYFPGDSFENFIYITIVELVSYIVADFTFERLGDHPSAKLFVGSFIISMIGSIGILSIDPTV